MKIKKLFIILFMLVFYSVFIGYSYADNDTNNGDVTETVPAESQDAIGNMLLQSVSLMGIPYHWGGNTPQTGMDCSGFIRYVFKQSLGITLPRTAAEMSRVGKKISVNQLEPGDLLFFNTRRGPNTHVGMYLGDNKMIVAPRTGQDIQIAELNGYYRSHLNGAKRIVQENVDDSGNTVVESYQEFHDQVLPSNYISTRRSYHHSKGRRTKKYKNVAKQHLNSKNINAKQSNAKSKKSQNNKQVAKKRKRN